MIEALPNEDSSGSISPVAVSVSRQASLLSLAGDALCMAVTALRLSPPPPPPPTAPPPPGAAAAEREVTLDQVAWHDRSDDCWVVVYDRVYDVTRFMDQHPGGEEVFLEYAGRDATMAFRGIGHGAAMLEALEPSLVGVLPQCERIYSCPGGKLSGLL
ncbi:uncharacterized protein LOC134538693 [Bacillus rossius redtenbacheri]|uniref:uncharacterized protein LOC134538693 n=1 Tax=Bacillus rossius redtenbacheri TaxID=93214 RepID=UPI002FDE95A9